MQRWGTKMKKFAIMLSVITILLSCNNQASEEIAEQEIIEVSYEICPPEIEGRVLYIPFPCDITVDGDISDWEGLPENIVARGTMVSTNSESHTDFKFSVAAKGNTIYAYMKTNDTNIITGMHESNYWNEDSMEIYFNFSDDVFAKEYDDNIYQININPGNIGNTDPKALTITGSNSEKADLSCFVFKTDDGWAFEMAVVMPFDVEHGKEIGFQAHANGATVLDRDQKLIWSHNDQNDSSYNNPRVFGQALFFEIGETILPNYSVYVKPKPDPFITVNQTGYYTDGPKFAVFPTEEEGEQYNWTILDLNSGEEIESGKTEKSFYDEASGDYINLIDFSDFDKEGDYYFLIDLVVSEPFTIGDDIYKRLPSDAMSYFYMNRTAIDIEEQYTRSYPLSRSAGHITDNNVTGYKGMDAEGNYWDGTEYTLDASKGWYDAGDVGKYVVNGGIAVWTLMNVEDILPGYFADSTLNIPENNNGVPDVLDEARWEMEFLLGMMVPDGYEGEGMVHHKLHDVHWGPIPMIPPAEWDNDNNHTDKDIGRYLMPPSTAATLNVAATAAQSARLWADYDLEFSERCLVASEKAWNAANENPLFFYGHIPGDGGGDYNDDVVLDEFLWAAAELYITTGKDEYKEYILSSPYFRSTLEFAPEYPSAIWWSSMATLARISLVTVENGLDTSDKEMLRNQIIEMADYYLSLTESEGYKVALPTTGYVWGSNSNMLNNAIIIAYAHSITGDEKYMDGLLLSMDYLLGRNALNHSFISGYGTKALSHPLHHYWADQPGYNLPKVPPGVLAGGPNEAPSDPTAMDPEVMERGISKRYVDSILSWSTNEVAINWNSPLVWISAYIDSNMGK